MNAKADANMWWIIIGAVLALVALVILMVMFSGGTTKFNIGILDCESKGGSCVEGFGCKTEGGTPSTAFSCPNQPEDYPCCFGVKPPLGSPSK